MRASFSLLKRHCLFCRVRAAQVWFLGLFALVLPFSTLSFSVQNVELLYFRAAAEDDFVLVEWATGSEFDILGFIVQRSSTGEYADFTDLSYIPSAMTGSLGAVYQYQDDTVAADQMVYYRLVVLANDNTTYFTQPVLVLPRDYQYRLYLPMNIRQPGGQVN